jgi:hypothetical protein
MKKFTLLLLIIFSFFIIRCSDDSPTDPLPQNSKGKMVIKSNPSGARIYLMGTDTGKNTPDSLDLDPGTYDFFLYKQYFDTAFFSAKVIENLTTTKEIALQDGTPFVVINLDHTYAFTGDSVKFTWIVNQDILIDSIVITRPINSLPEYMTDRYVLNKRNYEWEDQLGNQIQYYLPLPELDFNYYPRIEGFTYDINFYGQKAHGLMTSFHLFFSQVL